MFHISGHLTELSVDIKRYTKTLDKEMNQQMRQAARAWLRAILPKIPVYTGAARASFRPLGAFLRVHIPLAPIIPAKMPKAKMPPIATKDGVYSFTKEGFVYTFSYDVKLFYITINEFYDVSGHIPLINPTPWEAFKAGEEAWDAYIKDVAPTQFPRPEEFITSKEITIR